MAKAKIACLTSERSERGVEILAAIAKEFPAIFHPKSSGRLFFAKLSFGLSKESGYYQEWTFERCNILDRVVPYKHIEI